MFVVTADQVGSRSRPDAVARTIDSLAQRYGHDWPLPAERTAGDEFQMLMSAASPTVDAVLGLARDGGWSIGLGVGTVRRPLPASIREATGDAFVGARAGIERAKRKATRVALEAPASAPLAARAEAVLDLLLATRSRRSPEGWELHDLLRSGLTQRAAADRLGITPQAASLRAQAADLRIEAAATEALVSLLEELDESTRKE